MSNIHHEDGSPNIYFEGGALDHAQAATQRYDAHVEQRRANANKSRPLGPVGKAVAIGSSMLALAGVGYGLNARFNAVEHDREVAAHVMPHPTVASHPNQPEQPPVAGPESQNK